MTQVVQAFSTMFLGWLKGCPTRFKYAAIDGWESKTEAFTLRFGREYQTGLEIYDRLKTKGIEHNEAVRQVVRNAMESTWLREHENDPGRPWGPTLEDREPNRNRETLVRSLVWRLDQFEHDPAKTIVLSDGNPAVELLAQVELNFGPTLVDGPNYLLTGHIDRLVEFAGEKFVVDHKHTVHTLGPAYFSRFDLDNQMSQYSVLAKINFDIPVKGVMVDAAQVAVGFTRFERGYTYRTTAQLDEWLADAKFWIKQAEGFAVSGRWPMNDTACFLCPFKKVCAKDPHVREHFLNANFVKRRKEPLELR